MNAPAKTAIAPGHYPDMSNSDYHAGSGVSKSGVSKLLKSPAHYWAAYMDPENESKDPTPAMVMGSLTHTLVLEPEKLESEYIVAPEISRRSKAGKEAWEKFTAEAGSRQIISQEQLDQAKRIREAVAAHSFAGPALSGGKAEHSFFWEDELTGVLAKCRPDYIRELPAGVVLLDVKTTDDASASAFAKTCANFGYHISAAMTMDGYEAVTGIRPLAYKFVVIERDKPFGIAVYDLEQPAVALGREQYQTALSIYRECVESGAWNAYPENSQTINLPVWAYPKEWREYA